MKIKHSTRLFIKGRCKLTARDRLTHEIVAVLETKNIVVTAGKVLTACMLADDSGYDTGLTYFAIGTGTATPALTDTILGNEVARKTFTEKIRTDNVIWFSTYLISTECTYNLKEIGIFGHSTATATKDSGMLFCRALLAFDNSAGNYDLTYEWTLTIG
jgi:hypothetical protein